MGTITISLKLFDGQRKIQITATLQESCASKELHSNKLKVR